jgi:hypothetical protein
MSQPRSSIDSKKKYMLKFTSNRIEETSKVNKYHHSSMTDRLGQNYVDKIRKLIHETDLVDELAKRQKVGWASISQLNMLHQKQQIAKRVIGKSDTRENLKDFFKAEEQSLTKYTGQESKFSARLTKSNYTYETRNTRYTNKL